MLLDNTIARRFKSTSVTAMYPGDVLTKLVRDKKFDFLALYQMGFSQIAVFRSSSDRHLAAFRQRYHFPNAR